MDRRSFFGAAVAGAATLAVGATAPAAPPLRAVYRYSYATDTWARVRMWELKKGDVFRIEEPDGGPIGTFAAHDAPYKCQGGRWGIDAAHEIEPATNQWKPCNG